jgi:phage terminase small subunit
MADESHPLTPKQQAFVMAYIGEARFNAAKAAKMAGYSEASARQRGYELVTNRDIAARIKAELATMAIPAEAVLVELADVATAEWRDFVTVRTNPKTGEAIEVKMDLGSKVKALETLAKAHGLLTDRVDISGNMTTAIELVGINPEDV